jgi:hypothetical protein
MDAFARGDPKPFATFQTVMLQQTNFPRLAGVCDLGAIRQHRLSGWIVYAEPSHAVFA